MAETFAPLEGVQVAHTLSTSIPGTERKGRPVEFGLAEKEHLLDLIANGAGNDKACREVGICRATLYRTLSRDPAFSEAYDAAKRGAVDAIVDHCEELAERALHAQTGAEVAGIALAIKFGMWRAGRIAPRRWGDRADVHITTTVSMDETEMAKRVAFLEALRGSSSE